MSRRLPQIILMATFFPLCWLGMMALHELGHVASAWVSGGTVTKVVLHPLAISRTDVAPNPSPLFVVWCGPLVGALLPMVLWSVLHFAWRPASPYARVFAGFCLIANGLYIGAGSFDGVGDAGEMLREGTPIWVLWVFGAVGLGAGLALWNRTGSAFGLGEAQGNVPRWAAWGSAAALAVMSGVLALLSDRA